MELAPDDEYAAFPKMPVYKSFIRESVDLSALLPPPGDQGDQGSCTAWAVGWAARAYYAHTAERRPLTLGNIPSPGYIYNVLVARRGLVPTGSKDDCQWGTRIDYALELLKEGVPSEADAPYRPQFCAAPSQYQSSKASDFRIREWRALGKGPSEVFDDVRGALSQNQPVIIAIKLRDSFFSYRSSQASPRVYESNSMEHCGKNIHCHHAMVVVGYRNDYEAFKVVNSWGTEKWGDNGYGWIGYETFKKDITQAYVITAVAGGLEPRPPAPPPPSRTLSFDFVKCGYVETYQGSRGVAVRGLVGTHEDLDKARRLAREFNVSEVDIALRPFPQCEALKILARGLSAKDRPLVRIRRSSPETPLAAGSDIVIDVETARQWLHVTYLDADGGATHLVNNFLADGQKGTWKKVFGEGTRDGRRTGRWQVGGPTFGPETVIAIATESSLFSSPRPSRESARDFLTALDEAIRARPLKNQPHRAVAAAYDAIETVQRQP